jgi:hypothetical protein
MMGDWWREFGGKEIEFELRSQIRKLKEKQETGFERNV